MAAIKPVILAGGSGSRLWPFSRSMRPKQFLKLWQDQSLFEITLSRLSKIDNISDPIIICNDDQRFLVSEQLANSSFQQAEIILEPVGKDTAPAIASAALYAAQKHSDCVLLVVAADHIIQDETAFSTAVAKATASALTNKIATFGIVPTSPHIGYGYIKGEANTLDGAQKVLEFVEKPDLATATEYLNQGNYFWNSGMFLFKPSVMIQELKRLEAGLLKSCQQALEQATSELGFTRLSMACYSQNPSISIDYAVMEKTDIAVIEPLVAGWSDLGDWKSLWEACEKDDNGNAIVGDVIAIDTKNSYVRANQKLVTTIGLDNVVVVETKDAILVADKESVQQIKDVVGQLKSEGRSEASHHRHVYRPWGLYDSIDHGKRFQVKRILVKPNSKLSVQMHHHRSEHWIVVSGTALVTIGDETKLVTENQSVYIPTGAVHALENPGKLDLELIEVQTGSYLGEDDIVRFEDRYGRSDNNVTKLAAKQQSKQANAELGKTSKVDLLPVK